MACVELSRGTAYGLALSQMALTVGSVLFFPAVKVQVYTPTPSLVNGSLPERPDGSLCLGAESARYLMGGPLLASAGLTVYFAMTTLALQEAKTLDADYTPEGLENTGLWNPAYWLIFALSHLIVVLVLTEPCDAHAAGLSACLLVYFAYRGSAPYPGGYTQTQGNVNMLGYALGALLCYRAIPDTPRGPNRAACLAFMVMLDFLMGVGHTWENRASLDTVTNSRLFYACACSLGLCGLYAVWWYKPIYLLDKTIP